MDLELKARWVKALRSGEYEQTRGLFRSDDGKRHCCLGVLADIQGAKWHEGGWPIIGDEIASSTSKPTSTLRKEFAGGLESYPQQVLADKNDKGTPFPQIADYIEATL